MNLFAIQNTASLFIAHLLSESAGEQLSGLVARKGECIRVLAARPEAEASGGSTAHTISSGTAY